MWHNKKVNIKWREQQHQQQKANEIKGGTTTIKHEIKGGTNKQTNEKYTHIHKK